MKYINNKELYKKRHQITITVDEDYNLFMNCTDLTLEMSAQQEEDIFYIRLYEKCISVFDYHIKTKTEMIDPDEVLDIYSFSKSKYEKIIHNYI